MRIWRRQPPPPRSDAPAETRPEGASEPAEEPSTEQVLEAGPALDWGGDPSRITG
ncbi:MAG: hypothetical protein ACK46X_19515 [Candidatus Sericytochromatia bacterium]